MSKRFIVFVIALSVLAACNTGPLMKPPLSMRDKPGEWQEGYRAGCASAYSTGGSVYYNYERDEALYGENEQYTEGWDSGAKACLDRMSSPSSTNPRHLYIY